VSCVSCIDSSVYHSKLYFFICLKEMLFILFEVGRKLKVSLAAKRMKFFGVFNYIYGCVGAAASPMVLCHLLNTFCLPILLYGLEAVPLSHANFTTLQSTWRVALYKIFRLRDVNNLLYIQSCMSIIPITFAVDLRKLVFLHKLSVHAMSTVHTVFFIVASKEYEFLCEKHCVTKGHFRTCV